MSNNSVFRHLVNESLVNYSGTPRGNFQDNLLSQNPIPTFFPYDGMLEMEVDDDENLLSGLAFETRTRAFAMVESVLNMNRPGRSYPWRFIQMYYSAFFAAQIIMRLTGRWVIRLQKREDISDLVEIYQGLKVEPLPPDYFCSFSNPQTIQLTPCMPLSELGSHQLAWKSFALCLDKLISILGDLDSADARDVGGQLLLLVQDLGGIENPFFMPQFRNTLNYRSGFGLWFPHDSEVKAQSEIFQRLLNIELQPVALPTYASRRNSVAQKFLGCAQYIVGLSLWLIADSCHRFPRNRIFLPELERLYSFSA
jgi:hypothetical protein